LSSCDRIVAIIHGDDLELKKTLAAQGIESVINPEADLGMGSSIACGIRASQASDGWCILPADMPSVETKTVELIYKAISDGATIAAPYFQGRRGHPVGFSRAFLDELQSLAGDVGARYLLQRHAHDIRRVESNDGGILMDIDTPKDLENAHSLKRHSRRMARGPD
jgi:molybdenum cofactor cytidylyltransferase